MPTRWEAPRNISPVEKRAAEDAVHALRQMLRPASAQHVATVLGHLRLHGRQAPQHDAGAWTIVIGDYVRHLADVPADILDDAADRWLASNPFWPAIADLRGVIDALLTERKNLLARAEKLAAGGSDKPGRYYPTDEERKRFADGFKSAAEILRNMPGPAA